MVIARAEMHVAAQFLLFAAHHHQHLGVGLVSDHAVHHMRADRLQTPCPVDVGFLVEARQQLHHHRDFLAALRRRDQRFHQFGIGARAVHRLLDGDHVRIAGGLLDEIDTGLNDW